MNQEMTSSSQSLTALQIVIISISVLVFMLAITYLIMSKFGSKTLVETFYGAKPTAIYAVIYLFVLLCYQAMLYYHLFDVFLFLL